MTPETLDEAIRLTKLIRLANDLEKVIQEHRECGPQDGVSAKLVVEGPGGLWDSHCEMPVNWIAGFLPFVTGTRDLLQAKFDQL